ncbi:tRNA lysidine(34) synthetase TilS [Spongisporangium articulatum]|uniref:tRNA(Ile)-lysidine synthase n=1 Tax=Spongisporangium articulatum TaxID=3362603 RepID=A0ABW8ANI8_9ACTN
MDAVAQVVVAVRDALLDLPDGSLVLVACSGGADSLALAAATARVASRGRLRAGAVVVDHGWTTSASRAARRAAVQLKDLGPDLGLDLVELVRVDAHGPGGPEASARTARYRALDEAATWLGADAVLLGHTLDDQAETVLLGLGRGSGARSLAGMPAVRGLYRRPFLGLRREQTAAACAALGLRPWNDPANADRRYARVRVRELLPQLERALGPGTAEALARTGDLLREDADVLDQLGVELAGAPVDALLAVPSALRRRALLAEARAAGCPAGALTHRHALALEKLLTAVPGTSTDLPGGVAARRGNTLVEFLHSPAIDPA